MDVAASLPVLATMPITAAKTAIDAQNIKTVLTDCLIA